MSARGTSAGPLVGRDRELGELRRVLAGAEAGTGRTVFLRGDAGIGKTCLAETMVNEARERGFWIIAGRVWPLDAGLAYAPVAQALGPWLRGLDDESRTALVEGLPELARLLGDLGLPPATPLGDPALEKTRLFEALARLLERAADHEPTVLLLDDLHHADRGTIELLHYLMRRLDDAPLVMVATVRTHASRPALDELIRHAQLAGLCGVIDVGPLGRESLRHLAEHALGGRAADEVVDLLAERTGGAPFFASALVRTLRREHKLALVSDAWRLRRGAHTALPPEVRQLIVARLQAVDDGHRTVLEHLAVGGSPVSLQVLQKIVPASGEEVVQALEAMCARGILVEQPAADAAVEYAFHHPLAQEVVYEHLSEPRRRSIHARYLQAARDPGGAGASPSSLAWHVRGVGPDVDDPERAVGILLATGREALETGAFEDALTWLEPAWALVQQHEADRDLPGDEVLEAIAEARGGALNLAGAAAAWTTAFQRYRRAGRTTDAARVQGQRGLALWDLGRLDESVETLRSAAASLQDGGPSAVLAMLYQMSLIIAWRRGERRWVREIADAIAAWRDVPDEVAFAVAMTKVHRHIADGHLAEAAEAAHAAVEEARTPMQELLADKMLIALCSVLGVGGTRVDAAVKRRQGTAFPWPGPPVSVLRGSLRLHAGDLRGAIENWREAAADVELPGVASRLAVIRAIGTIPMIYQGELDEARGILQKARAQLEQHLEDYHVRTELEAAETLLALESGNLQEAAEIARGTVLHELAVLPRWIRAEALFRGGDADAAARAARAAAKHFVDVPLAQACRHRIDGLIRAGAGDHSGALAPLTQARTILRDADFAFFRAIVDLEGARSAAELTSRRRDAIAAAGEALATFEDAGAERYAERARALLRKLGQRVTAPRRYVEGPLSARELEVARLAARGKTNATIGKTLFISPHTAATHMKKIYARTGVRNRLALAEWLRANDLWD